MNHQDSQFFAAFCKKNAFGGLTIGGMTNDS